MKPANVCVFWGIAVLTLAFSTLQAQTVTRVSKVLPFATQGTVASLQRGVEAPPSVSTSEVKTEASLSSKGTTTQATEGGRIVTGVDGATSLLLGTSGTARMGADSELKVPEAVEKNHSLELLKGRLFMNIQGDEIKKRGDTEFRLKTPAALLAVKGTKFFTISENGTEMIGVHEGRVTVTEPTSGRSIDMEAGNTVSVSPGILGEARAMSGEEKAYTSEYAAADLVRTPIPVAIKSPVPNTKKLQILLFQNGQASVVGEEGIDRVHYGTSLNATIGPYLDWRVLKAGRNSIPVSPRMSAEGVISYVWSARQPGDPYQCYFDYGGQSGTNYSDLNHSSINRVNPLPMPDGTLGKVVAITFRARSKNLPVALFASADGKAGPKAWSGLAYEGEWMDVFLLPQDAKTPPEFPYSHLALTASYKRGSTAAVTLALEMAGFMLLTLPN